MAAVLLGTEGALLLLDVAEEVLVLTSAVGEGVVVPVSVVLLPSAVDVELAELVVVGNGEDELVGNPELVPMDPAELVVLGAAVVARFAGAAADTMSGACKICAAGRPAFVNSELILASLSFSVTCSLLDSRTATGSGTPS